MFYWLNDVYFRICTKPIVRCDNFMKLQPAIERPFESDRGFFFAFFFNFSACIGFVIYFRFAEAAGNLAFCLIELDDLVEARQQCESALSLKPDYREAHWNYNTVLR